MSQTSSKGSRQADGLHEALKVLELAVQRVGNCKKEIAEGEQFARNKQKYRDEIEAKDRTIAQMENLLSEQRKALDAKEQEVLLADRTLQKATAAFRDNVLKQRDEMEKVGKQKDLEMDKAKTVTSQVTKKYDDDLKKAMADATRFKEALQTANADLKVHKAKAEQLEISLTTMSHAIGTLDSTEPIRERCCEWIKRVHEIAQQYGKTAIPSSVDMDGLFTALKISKFLNLVPESIPIANSETSAAMRSAALESLCTKEIATQLFTPFFPWQDPGAQQGPSSHSFFAAVMEQDQKRSAMLRSIVACFESPFTEQQEETAIRDVATKIVNVCHPLLQVCHKMEEFRRDLESLIRLAATLWRLIRRSPHGLAVISTIDGGANWGESEDYGVISTGGSEIEPDVPIAVLSPQIRSQPGESDEVLHGGVALWADQHLVVDGRAQYKIQKRRIHSSRGGGGQEGPGRRRQSVHQGPKPPALPTTRV